MKYRENKERARQAAIDWQLNNETTSYSELAEAGNQFNKLGKRYGLLREYRENAIPC